MEPVSHYELALVEMHPKLVEALQECATALESEQMQAVWSYLYAHGYKYTGPTVDMVKIKSLLEECQIIL